MSRGDGFSPRLSDAVLLALASALPGSSHHLDSAARQRGTWRVGCSCGATFSCPDLDAAMATFKEHRTRLRGN